MARTLKMTVLQPGTVTFVNGSPMLEGWSFKYPWWKTILLRTPWFTPAAGITADIDGPPNYRFGGWSISELQNIANSTRRIEA